MPGYLLPAYIEIKKELEGKNFTLLVLYTVSAPPSPNQGWHQPGIQVQANWNLIAHTLDIQMVPKTAKATTGHGSSWASHRVASKVTLRGAPSTS